MIILSHPTGNQNVRNALIALRESNLLDSFWTTLNWSEALWVNNLLPSAFRTQLKRRVFPDNIKCITGIYGLREIVRLIARGLNFQALIKHNKTPFCVDAIYQSLDRHVAKDLYFQKNVSAVYAYEDGAMHTFPKARRLGIKCIYELPSSYWRVVKRTLKEEAELEPEWASTLISNYDSREKLLRKDEELRLADLIIVPSNMVKDTLSEASGLKAPIKVISYGAPPVFHKPPTLNKKLRVLFVGVLNQYKGLSYLFKACSGLGSLVDLTLIGNKPIKRCKALETALKNHRWIKSLPHHMVLNEMQNHDVLVLPSLSEGFSLVILEAMSQGLPVIITEKTGGADIVTDRVDGFIIPIRSSEAISEKLEILAKNTDIRIQMGDAAREKAKLHTWEHYRNRFIETIKNIL